MSEIASPYRQKCGVLDCDNEAVRELRHKEIPSIFIGVCAFHVRRMLKYVDNEKVREVIWPDLAHEGGSTT